MRIDLDKIENEIKPLATVHGVELVAIEWLQGPGHGILRVVVDRPGGDPREADSEKSVGLEQVTDVTRDVSTMLDALDLIEASYTLEVGSPGPERPVQKRADFERFEGLSAWIQARGEGREKTSFQGTLRGCTDHGSGFCVRIETSGKVFDVPSERIIRARLHEISPEKTQRPGKILSRRQERLAARASARAINAAHMAALKDPTSANAGSASNETNHESNPPADSPRVAKR